MINLITRFFLNQKTWGILIGEDINKLKEIPQPFWCRKSRPLHLF